MAEDCLYLSIWTPASFSDQLRAVMVLLTSGKEEGDLSGVEMAATGDVVFVRVESRHGALGFLASEESLVTTNIGLLDQTLALKWIQGNIDLFGGDSSRVTILGRIYLGDNQTEISPVRLRLWWRRGLPPPPGRLLLSSLQQHDPPVRQPLHHHRLPPGGHQEGRGAG